MNRLMEATPKQLAIAAAIILLATVVIAEVVLAIDRLAMARYDPTKLAEEVEEYLDRENTEDGD